ncbi:MAG: bifunctional DNA-binding transcriptional regulator/O6-methylguanine-DNA methyltransferase Ada [Rhodospirillales bacterium]|nr:bifunctional DNA-binding transcriptional regulator/O6-methylguanine-DNA methyltransferase Ada [Rhodospirillales bacterium]
MPTIATTSAAAKLTPSQSALDAARWSAVLARDATAAGDFRYGVRSTGIYCRPGCGARRPRRENVAFFRTSAEARAAGFRPCRRCRPDASKPDDGIVARIDEACRLIEAAEEAPTLETVARAVGLSRHHFHRAFTAALGVTPRAYAAACRTRRLRAGLGDASSVTAAAYGAGFNSSGRFYAQSNAILGMTPRAYRAGGADAEIRFAVGQCALGAILVAATGKGICAISLGDDPETLVRDLEDRFSAARLIGADPAFEATVARVVGLIEATGASGARLDMPLDIRGTAFQQQVWQALCAIPPGETRTYSEIAADLGTPRAVRAVARACAANPLAVAIPCHRVVRRDGDISGYRWGVERKRALLEREARG